MGYEWKDSLRGVAKGAQAGSVGGPIGMIIGAITGGTIGGFGDDLDKRITGDSQNNITDQMLSLASMAGSMGNGMGGGASGGASAFGNMPNIEFADGSGRYLAGNAPSSGSFVDGKFLGDLGGMFGQGGGMSPKMPSGGMDPNSFDWSNILKMLGSAGTMGSGSEQAQPTMGGMVPRLPVPIAPVIPQATRGEGYYQTWLRQNNLS